MPGFFNARNLTLLLGLFLIVASLTSKMVLATDLSEDANSGKRQTVTYYQAETWWVSFLVVELRWMVLLFLTRESHND